MSCLKPRNVFVTMLKRMALKHRTVPVGGRGSSILSYA